MDDSDDLLVMDDSGDKDIIPVVELTDLDEDGKDNDEEGHSLDVL